MINKSYQQRKNYLRRKNKELSRKISNLVDKIGNENKELSKKMVSLINEIDQNENEIEDIKKRIVSNRHTFQNSKG